MHLRGQHPQGMPDRLFVHLRGQHPQGMPDRLRVRASSRSASTRDARPPNPVRPRHPDFPKRKSNQRNAGTESNSPLSNHKYFLLRIVPTPPTLQKMNSSLTESLNIHGEGYQYLHRNPLITGVKEEGQNQGNRSETVDPQPRKRLHGRRVSEPPAHVDAAKRCDG